MRLVPGVVHARDDLGDAVVLARELADDQVVLVVPGDGDDDVGRALDARVLEHRELGAVAGLGAMAELLVEGEIAVAALLHDHDLVPELEQLPRHARAHLAPADDDDEAHGSDPSSASAARASIALVVGETTSNPRSE